ncbi:MAG TPA: LysR family transcriptional regulator [Burkholderiales bacterium]|nr:LysR family transcriptional regulator [Burkholderiales bacterium]
MNLLGRMASFAVVVKAGSFTRAAARLGLSKSVVSRHISLLEKELGVQLMYRSTHKLSLTEAGERFYAYCKDLEQVSEQAVAVATAGRERPRGLLRVTLPQTLVVSPVGPLISRFQQKYPEVQVDVRVTSLQIDPIEEGFDLALRIGDLEDSNLISRKLRDVRFMAVAAPKYLKQHGAPRTPEDLKHHNCLIYSEFASRTRWPEALGARRKPVTLSGNLSTNSGVLLLHALLAGQGIVVGPDLMFEQYLGSGRVKAVLQDFSPRVSGLYAVFPPGRFPAASRMAFIDFLHAALAG